MDEIFLEIEVTNQPILEVQLFLSEIDKKKFTPKHSRIKLQKTKQILKQIKKFLSEITFIRASVILTDFSKVILEARRQENDVLNVLGGRKNCQQFL